MATKLVTVAVDVDDVLSDIDTEELLEELRIRGEDQDPDWERLYNLLATKQDAEAMRLVREMVEAETGRIIP